MANLTKDQIATNLNTNVNSAIVERIYKLQFVKDSFEEIKENLFIPKSLNQELRGLELNNDFGMFEDSEIEANKKRFKEIIDSAITLEQAFLITNK